MRNGFGIGAAVAAAFLLGDFGWAWSQTPAKPVWVRQPNPAEFGRALPPLAALLGIAGEVELDCAVTGARRLADCKVVREEPKGILFGSGALALTPLFEIASSAAPGSRVAVPIEFEPDDWTAPLRAMAPTPAPAERMALARRLAALRQDARVFEVAQSAQFFSLLSLHQRASLSDAAAAITFARAVKVMGPAIARGAEALAEARAQLYARTYTAKQLEEIVAFHETSAARALLGGSASLEPGEAARRRLAAEETRRSTGVSIETKEGPDADLDAAPLTEAERAAAVAFRASPTGLAWFENNAAGDLGYRIAGAIAWYEMREAARIGWEAAERDEALRRCRSAGCV